MATTKINGNWYSLPAARIFDQDHAAWIAHTQTQEPAMTWSDLSPHTRNAYALHCDLAATYTYLSHKGRLPAKLPSECTPDGFYYAAVESRDRQVGLQRDMLDVPAFDELSPFSRFIYSRIAERLRTIADTDDGLNFEDEL